MTFLHVLLLLIFIVEAGALLALFRHTANGTSAQIARNYAASNANAKSAAAAMERAAATCARVDGRLDRHIASLEAGFEEEITPPPFPLDSFDRDDNSSTKRKV